MSNSPGCRWTTFQEQSFLHFVTSKGTSPSENNIIDSPHHHYFPSYIRRNRATGKRLDPLIETLRGLPKCLISGEKSSGKRRQSRTTMTCHITCVSRSACLTSMVAAVLKPRITAGQHQRSKAGSTMPLICSHNLVDIPC